MARFFVLFTAITTLAACSSSPPPSVSELVSIKAPSFDGQLDKIYTVPTQRYTLRGECDRESYLLEYSIDGGPFTRIDERCPTGTFAIPLTVILHADVRVRAKGKFDYTDIARARLNFVPPPTSPSLQFVQSSAADSSDLVGAGTQNTMSLNFSGGKTVSRWFQLDFDLVGIVYGK